MRDFEVAPEFFYHWYKKRKVLPENPAGFEPRSSDRLSVVNQNGPIRVLIVERHDKMRMIANIDELINDCNSDRGPWECRSTVFGSSLLT